MIREAELQYLRRAIELAEEAMAAGDRPFGSVLVSADGEVLAEDRNRAKTGDATRHPEFELARWAAIHLSPEERAGATVYTSGEHCAMCAAAHGLAGLGRIVYVTSSRQLAALMQELGVRPSPVAVIPSQTVAPGVTVEGPVEELSEKVLELHRRYVSRGGYS